AHPQTILGARSRTDNESLLPDSRRVPGMLVHREGELASVPSQESARRTAGSTRPDMSPAPSTQQPEIRGLPARPATESLPGFPSADASGVIPSPAGKAPPRSNNRNVTTPVMPAIILPQVTAAEDAPQPLRSSPLINAQPNPSLVQAIEALRLADRRFW